MTTKKELDALASSCLECAEGDPSSLDNHFENCKICVEYGEKVESHEMTLEVLDIMVTKSEQERRRILESRMERFFSQSEQGKRMDLLRGLMDPLNELSEADRVTIVRTRTRILTGLPAEKRKMLIASLQEIYSEWEQKFRDAEKRAIQIVSGEYPFLKRAVIRHMHTRILK